MDLYCTCGQLLNDDINPYKHRIEIEACDKCLDAAKDAGYVEGKEDAERNN